ncbi:TetR/AcrR family transcriptional regulator (plasmid) [Photobacterium sp. DA100]|uniref:TetR/AcrR family transcriptional regulator n=1 Tax=Photobacterium sp. DA100 TaxID=3027472 RepID=UPI002479C55D|nr:TetR/AcrR family transcriptional regulator [Photobacterium sp. DA100]WEM44837.1 TetR/AcrR family transcriptional regulator [Photobacterium sp. DA100]
MTVKGKKRGRPSTSAPVLSKERIIECANTLMAKDSKIPSIRKLAASLEVDPMAIYYYFTNKQALLEAVTVSLVAKIYTPKPSGDWQHELPKLCESYLNLLAQYPGLLETLLGMTAHGPAAVFTERFDLAVKELSLEQELRNNALSMLADYLHGYALAMSCQAGDELKVDMMAGPLGFYMQALQQMARP